MLMIHNSLLREKVPFQPLQDNRVRMYVCGVTVYDYCHVGHARFLVVFDMVSRYLRTRGYDVTYVRNITDVDDKIIKRAKENGESIDALTERFVQAMDEDTAALKVMPPDMEPRATTSMDDIVSMIGRLVDKGYAYQGSNGDIYYDVSKFAGYGRLSGRRMEDLRAGARVEVDEAKDDPLDFVLWKSAKPDEPSWPSPWGPGRPGWHIECSAMSTRCLGEYFDIHGGGMDLQFPHHENEIAQSCAASGEPFVNVWMHNGFVQIDDEKMSKSLGNFFTIREVLERYQGEVIRYFILNSHYRSPINYSDQQLDSAQAALERLYTALRDISAGGDAEKVREHYAPRFYSAMDDDFNTPVAIAVLFDIARDINRARADEPRSAADLAALLRELGGVLGLLQDDPDTFLRGGARDSVDAAAVEALIAKRDAARAAKDWREADRVRDELTALGVVLEDGPEGTRWRRG